MNIGDIVWTCNQSIESESYGVNEPHSPWKGKITKIYHLDSPQKFTVKVSRLDTNGNANEDSNASAFCKQNDIFLTKEDAQIRYIQDIGYYIDSLKEQINKWSDILIKNC